MRTPLLKKSFHQNQFLVFIHAAPFILGLLFVEAHILAQLSEEELSALPHRLIRFQRMRVHSRNPNRKLGRQPRVAEAAVTSGGARDSCGEFVGGESDGRGGVEKRGRVLNFQSHRDRWIRLFRRGEI